MAIAGEYALALHRWASASVAAVDRIVKGTPEARKSERDKHDYLLQGGPPPSSAESAMRERVEAGRLATIEGGGEKVKHSIYARCRPVFPVGTRVAGVNGTSVTSSHIGELTPDGLRGHEGWLERQRTDAEARLRA